MLIVMILEKGPSFSVVLTSQKVRGLHNSGHTLTVAIDILKLLCGSPYTTDGIACTNTHNGLVMGCDIDGII